MTENRTYPRTRLTLPVTLYCDRNNQYYDRRIGNISLGGIFISGLSCGRTGMQFELAIHSGLNSPAPVHRFPAEILRSGPNGFALKFRNLGTREKHLLEDAIWPKWDGQDSFEGLIMVAAREDAHDLRSWLHLTSIVCNQYRRICFQPGVPHNHNAHYRN